MWIILATLQFITLHAPDGSEVSVNIDHVISMRGRKESYKGEYDAAGYFTENARCLLNIGDGKFVSVKEDCKEVMRIFVDSERQQRQKEQP